MVAANPQAPVTSDRRVTVNPLVGKQRRSVELANARINLWEGSVRSSKTVRRVAERSP